MPFIDSKITVKVSDEKKEVLKAKIGKAVSIIGKPESFLMVGFEDEYNQINDWIINNSRNDNKLPFSIDN